MNSLEDQIGETPTLIAPYNWVELQREQERYRRRISVRELFELLALAIVVGAIVWAI